MLTAPAPNRTLDPAPTGPSTQRTVDEVPAARTRPGSDHPGSDHEDLDGTAVPVAATAATSAADAAHPDRLRNEHRYPA
ncbi:hypothetical protein ACL02T_31450 [Pseudonocardia sp. RS010]|uniref:hypothetical protein n=1 Tax=Pseudonocardia sp. RS010 TaxID=3385979 RepID=UPI00399FB5C7